MVRRWLLSAALLLALAVAAAPARPVANVALPPAGSRVSLCYELTWAGFGFADLAYTFMRGADAAGDYRSELLIETFGLVHLLSPFRYAASSQGRLGLASGEGASRPAPERYVAYDGPAPEDRKRIELVFDAATGAVDEDIWPPRQTPKVPPALRRGALDPLSAMLGLRQALWRKLNGGAGPDGPVVAAIYDGSKRYDVEVSLPEDGGRRPSAGPRPMIRLAARLRPIAGFREAQLRGLPDQTARVEVTDDADFIPARVQVGWGSMTLRGVQKDGRDCAG